MKPTANFETITPQIAADCLSKNAKNRPLSIRALEYLADQMSKDNFMVTGEAIKFNVKGELIDGQHRLQAIIKAKKSVDVLVIRNLEEEVFKVLDTGKRRSAGDVLFIEGIKNSRRIASMAKFVIRFQKGKYGNAAFRNASHIDFLTNMDISDFVHKNKSDLEESYPYGYNSHNKFAPGNVLASLHFVFNKINSTQADDFCYRLVEGIDLKAGNPILQLRNMLTADIHDSRKMNPVYRVAIICKAWNHYRGNKTVGNLKWDSSKEPFPKPI